MSGESELRDEVQWLHDEAINAHGDNPENEYAEGCWTAYQIVLNLLTEHEVREAAATRAVGTEFDTVPEPGWTTPCQQVHARERHAAHEWNGVGTGLTYRCSGFVGTGDADYCGRHHDEGDPFCSICPPTLAHERCGFVADYESEPWQCVRRTGHGGAHLSEPLT